MKESVFKNDQSKIYVKVDVVNDTHTTAIPKLVDVGLYKGANKLCSGKITSVTGNTVPDGQVRSYNLSGSAKITKH